MLARALLQDASTYRAALVAEHVEPSPDDVEYKEFLAELRGQFSDNLIKAVARVHQRVGHPSPECVAAELVDQGYDEEHSSCARRFRCEACLKRKRPPLHKPAKISTAKSFNDTVDIDVFHILWNDEKKFVLANMDEY